MLMREKEIAHIETVGDLRAALADCPDDMNICDLAGAGLGLSLCQDEPNGPFYVEVQ